MTTSLRTIAFAAACLVFAGAAGAQTTPSDEEATRPATATFNGDTGLWQVPTAEVLGPGEFSASVQRLGLNYVEGFTNVSDIAATGAVGLYRRLELFGSFKLDTRIDRDVRPVFGSGEVGAPVYRYPFMNGYWSGDNIGDLTVGLKVNLLSEEQNKPAAVAIRGAVKIPTGDDESGVSTGKADTTFDFVVSKNVNNIVEVSAYGGAIFRGSPDAVSVSNGGRWGFGAGFPSNGALRFTGELFGELPFDDTLTVTTPMVSPVDGSVASGDYPITSLTTASVGLTWQAPNGFFVGGGAGWNLPTKNRDDFGSEGDEFGDFVDFQIRIGYHPGVHRYVPPPPPPPPPAPPVNRPPTVRAQCDPCTVQVGGTSTLTATAQDPDGDQLTYRWTAPAGTFQNAGNAQSTWTAPQQPGPVPATVTVSDGKGGTATASVTVQVAAPPPVVQLTFEDVYFDFDRSTLRPEALRLLDDAVTKLMANPDRNIVIEGHTCNIGTAEYNLALGDRRAASVRDYLVSRGVPASRLTTRSYGEEAPKFDNSREETRRLNRRAALTVSVQ